MRKRTIIYLDPKLRQAFKMRAVQVHSNVSDLINEAIRLSLKEDAVDFQAVRDRRNEPTRSFEVVLKDLKGMGRRK
jgi:hypothetical protein